MEVSCESECVVEWVGESWIKLTYILVWCGSSVCVRLCL